ncbi:MAG TPA: hypothetical protein VJ654_15735 [Noviherbaspirillum sp.]|nr:hypothetical protein [Noviherbaspirillum sp.]
MEYLGFLSLGAAIAGVGLRCYFFMKEKNALQATETQRIEQPLSARARRVQEAVISRHLLRYHRGLSQA